MKLIENGKTQKKLKKDRHHWSKIVKILKKLSKIKKLMKMINLIKKNNLNKSDPKWSYS